MAAVQGFEQFLEWVNLFAFVGLAALSFRMWRHRRDPGSLWMFLTFLTLAVVVVIARPLPEDGGGALVRFVEKVVIAVLMLFPYCLYRVSAAFAGTSRTLDRLAVLTTTGVMVWAVAIPEFPGPDDVEPSWFRYFILAVVVDWVVLSVIVAWRFFRAGRKQATVAGRRMKALSIASVILSIAIVISGAAGEASVELDIVIQLMALGSMIAFYFSFAPPDWLRAAWRRKTEEDLRAAVVDLMAAETEVEVMGGLLPCATEIVGGKGMAILGPEGRVVGSYKMDRPHLDALEHGGSLDDREDVITLPFDFGTIYVVTDTYTPFFGNDEIQLLGSLGALANLALERVEATQLRLQIADSQMRRKQALEINDNVVQGLAVAKYAFDLGDEEKARSAVEGTLEAARSIIGDLVGEIGMEEVFGGGAVRGAPATGYSEGPRRAPAGRDRPSD